MKTWFSIPTRVFVVVILSIHHSSTLLTQFTPHVDAVPGQYLVQLSSSNATVEQDFNVKARASKHFRLIRRVSSVHDVIYLLDAIAPMTTGEVTEQLVSDFGDSVVYASKNFIARAAQLVSACKDNPAEPCRSQSSGMDAWGLSRISQRQSLQENLDHAYTWSDSNAGLGVTVYVLDSGVKLEHEEFKTINTQWGFTDPDLASYEVDEDLSGHGTHVAGVVAGAVYGVAKQARLVAVKVLDKDGTGTLSGVLSGLEYVLNDVIRLTTDHDQRLKTVVNLSWGFDVEISSINEILTFGRKFLGIIFVAAAGNDNVDACSTSPASSLDVITVGALDVQDRMTSFSNYGVCVDILAPGTDIKAAGVDSTVDYTYKSGTSVAAPFVAGVVARLLSHRQVWNNTWCLYEHLYDTATYDAAGDLKGATPNRMLYGGCNTCFNDRNCDVIDRPWTRPPESVAAHVAILNVNCFTLGALNLLFTFLIRA